jgi:stalled ribosome alternative rescue factor ArfA
MKTTAHKSASAKALADRKYHQRIVLAKKGTGSYNRKRMEKRYA